MSELTNETQIESHLHPPTSWSVADHPAPSGREEAWRFTPLARFAPLFDEDAGAGTLDWQGTLPQGVTVAPIDADQARTLAVREPVDRVAALAAAQAGRRVHLEIADEVQVSEPVVFAVTGAGATACDHQVITIGRHASATVVVRYTGDARYAEKLDVRVGDGARLTLVTVMDWDADAVHGGQRSILVGRDASARTVAVSLGGHVRLAEEASYAGPGGSLEQFGLYFVDAGQHIEHRLFVDHNQPSTHSNVDYRGALQGEGAHSVWVGDVLIRKAAEGITTYESNKNLVLSDGCTADSVPNLEIETGEIGGAGHSSTTGRFDDQQLFYLMSRGIPEEQAKRLVVEGFFADILRRIGVPELEGRLMEAVRAELDAHVTATTPASAPGATTQEN